MYVDKAACDVLWRVTVVPSREVDAEYAAIEGVDLDPVEVGVGDARSCARVSIAC